MIESAGPANPRTIEPGVNQVKAPNVWSLGFNGTGIVVANQDTGMRWTHNALKPHYRGWNGSTADHNYNWHDSIHTDINGNGTNPCGFNAMAPCDDQSHGRRSWPRRTRRLLPSRGTRSSRCAPMPAKTDWPETR